jgi:Uri superfamily endonuclease
MHLPRQCHIAIGNRLPVCFSGGYYIYVGSALGGVEARINRHLRDAKKKRWHIDYLLAEAPVTEVIIGETETKAECAVAQALDAQFSAVPNFGASDCRCFSHLFAATSSETLLSTVQSAFESVGLKPEIWKAEASQK